MEKIEFRRRPGPVTEPGEGDRSFLRDTVIPGAAAGLLGGFIMMVLWGFAAMAFGGSFWDPARMIASLLWRGYDLDQMGFWTILLGLFIHFNVSIALATAFALMLPRMIYTQFAVNFLAILYASVVFVLMNWLVVDYFNPLMSAKMGQTVLWLIHLPWGASLALIPALRTGTTKIAYRMPVFIRRESPI